MVITNSTRESCTDNPDGMTAENVKEVSLEDKHPSALAELVLYSWPSTKTKELREL